MTRKPQSSVLTSFDVNHFRASPISQTADPFPVVEVYAFMYQTLQELFQGKPFVDTGSTLRVLAHANKDPKEAPRIASLLASYFDKSHICALSSFLPEINCRDDLDAWRYATDALSFLVSVAHNLHTNHFHPCHTVELVAGSRVQGMYRGEDLAGDHVSVVNIQTHDAAVERFINRITPVATLALEKNVRLAVELEPGPLFTIGNWRSLLSLCNSLDSYNVPAHKAIGVNLDIAHWSFLAGISPRLVRSHPTVLKRIVHAHVSDHNRGHCSDAIPTMFHSAEAFLPWFQLLVELMNSQSTLPSTSLQFSGYVSSELESSYDLETVVLASRVVQHWIDYCC